MFTELFLWSRYFNHVFFFVVLFLLTLQKTQWSRYYYSCFIDKETVCTDEETEKFGNLPKFSQLVIRKAGI